MADASSDRELKNALAQIEKQFGKGAIMQLGEGSALDVQGISTGALSLDIALGGRGLPRGRIVEIFGPESSGKTTVALHALANAQRQGGVAAFIDAEHALDLGNIVAAELHDRAFTELFFNLLQSVFELPVILRHCRSLLGWEKGSDIR